MDGEPGIPGPTAGGLRISPVVLKTLVTIVVATIAYVITNLINQSQDELWKLAVSIVIGGAALIVQYMVDFEQRLASVETGHHEHRRDLRQDLATQHREVTDLVDRGFQRVGEVTGLFNGLDRSGMDAGDVTRLVRSATQVGSQGPEIVQAFARAEIERLASVMTELTSKTADWAGENNDWLIALTRCARSTIDATSSFVDLAFWKTEPAKHYLRVQRAAIERGVRVRRLFIVKDPVELNADLDVICDTQRRVGIDVRVVVLSELPSSIVVGETTDVVIFDGELNFEIITDLQYVNPRTRLDARERYVNDRMVRFDELWNTGLNSSASLGTPAGEP
jgi:hypothetical protein